MRRRYLITGQVQGVGFRYFTLRAAQRIGVRGWVRNRADGGVEVLAEGSEEQLARLESDLKAGPAGASVTNLQHVEVSDEGEPIPAFHVL